MAATSSDSHEVAGRKGLGLLSLTTLLSPEDIAGRIHRYRHALKEAKPVGEFINNRAAVAQLVHCAETNREAKETSAGSIMWFHDRLADFLRSFLQPGQIPETYKYLQDFGEMDMSKLTFDYLNDCDMVIVGDPATCARKLKIYKDLGVDLVLCMMQVYKTPHAKVMESIRLFGKQVIPQLQ